MTIRRVLVGVLVVSGLSVWAWTRADGKEDTPKTADPVYATQASDDSGNHDEALARYRSNQSRHWRQVMIGGH